MNLGCDRKKVPDAVNVALRADTNPDFAHHSVVAFRSVVAVALMELKMWEKYEKDQQHAAGIVSQHLNAN